MATRRYPRRVIDVSAAYSSRAAEYVSAVGTMDAVHPDDRRLVERWARSVDGPVLDAGCGPGHWTAHLAALGVDVRGVDLTPVFIDLARSRHPDVRFDTGSIDRLDEPDDSLDGILSWFSTIHHDPARIDVPLAEFARALRAGGSLLLGYFDADADAVESFDHAVVRAYRWPARALQAAAERAGFDVIETLRRAEPGRRPVGAIVCMRP